MRSEVSLVDQAGELGQLHPAGLLDEGDRPDVVPVGGQFRRRLDRDQRPARPQQHGRVGKHVAADCVNHKVGLAGRVLLPEGGPPRLVHVVGEVVEVQPDGVQGQALPLDLVADPVGPVHVGHLLLGQVERAADDRAAIRQRAVVTEVLPQTERDGGELEPAAPTPAIGRTVVAALLGDVRLPAEVSVVRHAVEYYMPQFGHVPRPVWTFG